MRRLFGRGTAVPPDVLAAARLRRGDRVLAAASSVDGTWLLGTRDALVIVTAAAQRTAEPAGARRSRTLRWEQVESADWDLERGRLRVTEVADYGEVRPVHELTLPDPGRLLQLVRERVTASVLLQRRVTVSGKRGLTVIARRPPQGQGPITWAVELDPGMDPDDPGVRAAAEEGLRSAELELGPGREPI